jgi:hypothetical protein
MCCGDESEPSGSSSDTKLAKRYCRRAKSPTMESGAERHEERRHPVLRLPVVAQVHAAVADVADRTDARDVSRAAGERIRLELHPRPLLEQRPMLLTARSLPQEECAAYGPQVPMAHARLERLRAAMIELAEDVIEAIDPRGLELRVEWFSLIEQ